jgi:rRNA maturation RNase YbeY
MDIIWVSDEHLRKMHEDYLEDNEFTDIMTFNLGNNKDIEAELYISLDRAIEHAESYHVSLENELLRLLVHGLLHLAGYDDKEADDRDQMRLMEDYYLDKFLTTIV